MADLQSQLWTDALRLLSAKVNRRSLPSAQFTSLPLILGDLSKVHDAVVAIFLGAMKIIAMEETITGPKLAQMIRTVSTCLLISYFIYCIKLI